MKNSVKDGSDLLSLKYDSLRNISCDDDTENGRRVLVGRALAPEFLRLTDENVRAYLVDAEGKKKKRRGDVHMKILDTIENYPENFCVERRDCNHRSRLRGRREGEATEDAEAEHYQRSSDPRSTARRRSGVRGHLQ